MIHIRCKKCGWREPYSNFKNVYVGRNRIIKEQMICQNCGKVLIKKKEIERNIAE
jgi:hypothetical protein